MPSSTDEAYARLGTGWDRYHEAAPSVGIVTSSCLRISRSDGCDLLSFHIEDFFLRKALSVAPHVVSIQCTSYWSDYWFIAHREELAQSYDARVYLTYEWGLDEMHICCTAETDAVLLRMILPDHIDNF